MDHPHCERCGKRDYDDGLTEDGLCWECDMCEALDVQLVTEENIKEMFDRLQDIVDNSPEKSFVVIDSLKLPS